MDREAVSTRLTAFGEAEAQWFQVLFTNPAMDDALLEGLHHYLDDAASARFLNSMKVGRTAEWLGTNAPGRLQVRLLEAARSSQHPAYISFREGLRRSGGLERAYPRSAL